jgi:multidrug efflux pump subunit AcrB
MSVPSGGLLGINDRFFRWFNRHFDATANRYQRTVAFSLGRAKRMMLIFLAVLLGVWLLMAKLPTSFLPDEDQGFVYVNVNLPAGASDARLQEVLDQVRNYLAAQPDVISFNQVSGLNGDQSSARGFIRLKPWSARPCRRSRPRPLPTRPRRTWRASAMPACRSCCRRPCAAWAPARATTSCSRTSMRWATRPAGGARPGAQRDAASRC